jgi:HlyD family secretion protein
MRKKPVPVKTVRAERARVRDVVTSSTAGEIVPAARATVRAELAARVTAKRHARGDRVKRGEVILQLDAADLEARVSQAKASLLAQEAQVGQADARVGMLRRQADRAKTLAERGAGTPQLSEDAALQTKEAEEAARAARAAIGPAEAAIRVAQVARTRAVLTAPFDGVLTDVLPDVGEELVPGAPVFEIIDDSRLHIEAAVEEADADRVRLGQPATITLDALPGRPVQARVSKIAPAVRKDLKGARTLPIEAEVIDARKAAEAGLRAGMSANVEVVVAERDDVLSLPTNVIVGRGVKRTVFVVEGGRARVRQIETGVSNWDRTEVKGGLRAGDEVVATLNSKDLEDGAQVAVGAVVAGQ